MMKRLRGATLLAIVAFLSVPGPVSGFEVGVAFQISDLGFGDARVSTDADYPLVFPWGLSLIGSHQVSDEMAITTGFYFDPVLNNISYTLLTYQQALFSLGVGPFFGFFNSANSILKPGISTAVRVDLPGLLFVSFRADASLLARLVQEGDYIQERSDVAVGFYVRNAICSMNLMTKSYTQLVETNEVVDSFAEYSFKTDIHQKNVPYRIVLTFGYQRRAKSFISTITRVAVDHVLNSAILGIEIAFEIGEFMDIGFNADSSIYSFGSAGDALLELPTTGFGAYLFDASIEFSLDFDALLQG